MADPHFDQAVSEIRSHASNASSMDPMAIVLAVQAWVWSHVRFISDQDLFGVPQRCISVEETLSKGLGDCEDYAWCCHVLAAALGVPERDLTIQLCLVNQVSMHVVLLYRGGELVLDNQLEAPRHIARRHDLSGLSQLAIASFPQRTGDPDPGLRRA